MFFVKTETPLLPKKSQPLFSSNPPLKIRDPVKSPLFENLVGGSTPSPLPERGSATMILMKSGI